MGAVCHCQWLPIIARFKNDGLYRFEYRKMKEQLIKFESYLERVPLGEGGTKGGLTE